VSKAQKLPTIRDVARLAGVSIQTVSAVVNGKPGITEATARRVRAAIDKVGYRPHSLAASMRTRKTFTIALIVSDIGNPYLARMASAVERHAQTLGYSTVFYSTHEDVEREVEAVRLAAHRWVDGMLIVSTQDNAPSFDLLRSMEGTSVVPIERIPQGYEGPCVSFDNAAAGRLAARHLVGLGHARLTHISGPLDLTVAQKRHEGFTEGCLAEGAAAPSCIAGQSGWDCENGYEAMQRVLQMTPLPTGIFCSSDRLAIGAMLAAHRAGLRIPQDVSFVGVDDIEQARYHIPPLTTIVQPHAEMATIAVKMLFELIAGNAPVNPRIVLPPELVVRDSTGPARDTGA
jgi:DNA-binding LacI/PurR family transcriptional regulator